MSMLQKRLLTMSQPNEFKKLAELTPRGNVYSNKEYVNPLVTSFRINPDDKVFWQVDGFRNH